MDIFDYMKDKQMEKESPLALRMRPRTLDEFVGQEHIVGKDCLLYRAIRADKLSSVIFYGPPGTGKTTLARVIANTTSAEFCQLNATTSGKKDMEEVVKQAQDRLGMYGRKTILFIDEIHRFNKGQQDYLLPFVEDGTIVLIGATTENPYFEVNGALLSRSIIFELKPLTTENIATILDRAATDEERGLGSYRLVLEPEARDFLADVAGGDARMALNALELGALTTERSEDGLIHITLPVAEQCIQKRAVRYDKNGDQHYDTISAFIKSMRGSDPDAAVYYLAKMLRAGEDVKFIARRITICASEDVGNADPMAMVIASSAAASVERVGMPESQLILAQAAIYVASAPKSNACTEAIFAAEKSVDEKKTTVPAHLQDAHYHGHENLGHGVGYLYAHDFPNHYVKQQYLPDEIRDETFYHPTDIGYEKTVREYFRRIGRKQ
ncbi:MAG: replication-associated recombination protein A [Bilifractor sp.]